MILEPNITQYFNFFQSSIRFFMVVCVCGVDALFYVVSNQKLDIGTNQRPVFGNLQISAIIHLSSNQKLYLQTNPHPVLFIVAKFYPSLSYRLNTINCLARSLVKAFIVLREVHTYTVVRRDWNT